jgi:hypothetical protein
MRSDETGAQAIADDWCRRWVGSVQDFAVVALSPEGIARPG